MKRTTVLEPTVLQRKRHKFQQSAVSIATKCNKNVNLCFSIIFFQPQVFGPKAAVYGPSPKIGERREESHFSPFVEI